MNDYVIKISRDEILGIVQYSKGVDCMVSARLRRPSFYTQWLSIWHDYPSYASPNVKLSEYQNL